MKTKVSLLLLFVLLTVSATFTGCGGKKTEANVSKDTVTVTDMGNYYEVNLDLRNNMSHRKLGEEYASKILQAVPTYESLVDSYLKDIIDSDDTYKTILKRIQDIKPQIDRDYRDELEGMGSRFSGSDQNVSGDGKLSMDELYMINLLPDVLRGTQCSALAVYGNRSETKHTLAGRILDWRDGLQNQLAGLQAVTTFKNAEKSICGIGYLGYIGVISGFNDDKVFAAILDSSTHGGYSSKWKRSYPMDLRHALENSRTLDDVAGFLKSFTRSYAFSHLIFLCDSNTSKVLENNISFGLNSKRSVRTENSKLNHGIKWGIDNSIGCVNSFVLKGNFDNHSQAIFNLARWGSLRKELTAKGDVVTLDEMKAIASYHSGRRPGPAEDGDLYNFATQQIIIFEPDTFNLQVFFRPKNGDLPDTPSFEKVRAAF